jgi:choline-sulfatase
MKHLVRVLVGIAAVAAGLGFFWVASRPGTEPNIVLITLDTTRADRIGAMGDPQAKTPVLDELASRGVLFERAYASVPLTLPSHTTMLTGLEPNQHGVHDNGNGVVPASITTVAERLTARGYDTAAFVAAAVLDARFGLDRGFALYDDEIERRADPLGLWVPSRRGDVVTDRSLAWLASRRQKPFFLWVHYYDVHLPRRPPAPFDAFEDGYAGALAYVDTQVGRLLERIAAAAAGRPTLILAIGDHGESLGEHGEATHGMLAYDATLHVPLIAAGPGFTPGTRSRAFVRTVDLAPTILAAAGVPPPIESTGLPLQKRPQAGDDQQDTGYFESFGPVYQVGWMRIGGVRTARWKYTAEPQPVELYDVVDDPDEERNQAAERPEMVQKLAALYEKVKVPEEARGGMPTLEVQERLAALGYVFAPQQFAPGQAPDPRNFVGAIGLVESSRQLAAEGRVADSIAALEILAKSPIVRALSLRSLAPLYMETGRASEAIDTYREFASLVPSPDAYLLLASALLAADRAGEALALIDGQKANQTPTDVRLHLTRGAALLALERPAEAAAEAETVLAREPNSDGALALAHSASSLVKDPTTVIAEMETHLAGVVELAAFPQTRLLLAQLLHRAKRDAEAVRVLEAIPNPPAEHRALLADIAADHGNPERAVGIYAAIVTERPASHEYRRRLAELLSDLGRLDPALDQYTKLIAANAKDGMLLVDRGVVNQRLGRMVEAEADYRQALALDGEIPEAYLNLALLELADERTSDAEQHLWRAVELRPNYAKAQFHLARLYTLRGDPRAAQHAEQAVGVGHDQ